MPKFFGIKILSHCKFFFIYEYIPGISSQIYSHISYASDSDSQIRVKYTQGSAVSQIYVCVLCYFRELTTPLGWGVTLMLTVPLHVTFARKGKVATPIKSLFMWGPKTTGRSTLSQIDNEEKFRISHLVCTILFLFGFLIIKTPTCVNLEPVGSHGGLCINSSPETRKLSHFEHQ